MKKLYKYIGPDLFKIIFRKKDFVELKATFPKDFNDPYELFLTINAEGVDPEILAFYQETVGTLPQFPTLCFSNQPDVVPMWAHYARESTGFIIELDEKLLLTSFPDERIDNVNYSDVSTIIDVEQVVRAHTTCKPRHTYFLQSAAFNAAYFTKSQYWSYESERRFVVKNKTVNINNDIMVLQIPIGCVTALIAGPRIVPKLEKQIQAYCKKANILYYKMQLGRSSMRSYFINDNNRSFLFDGQKISALSRFCHYCNEPIDDDSEQCPWCAITDEDRYGAATRNPMRLLARTGHLEDYLNSVAEIGKKHKS